MQMAAMTMTTSSRSKNISAIVPAPSGAWRALTDSSPPRSEAGAAGRPAPALLAPAAHLVSSAVDGSDYSSGQLLGRRLVGMRPGGCGFLGLLQFTSNLL